MIVVAVALGLVVLLLAVLTGIGEHRRGAGAPVVVLAGSFFPVTWLAWYVRDERPYRRGAQRTA